MSTEKPETYAQAAARLQRERHAGEIMAEPAAPPKARRLTEAERRAIEQGTKPGPVGKWFGYALGTIVAGGTLILVTILLVKAIVWAWSL